MHNQNKSMRLALTYFLLVSVVYTSASVGLSYDTSNSPLLIVKPNGTITGMRPRVGGNGWAIEMWIKYNPANPNREHTLFSQLADNFCVSTTRDNFQYSIIITAEGFISVNVEWCYGSLSLVTNTDALLPSVNEWHHVGITFTYFEGIAIYMDGKLIRASFQTHNMNDAIIQSFTGRFQNNGTLALLDDIGTVDEIRLWTVSRKRGEMSSDYCKRLRSSSKHLGWYVNFDSNLARDGITRAPLDTIFDLTSGANHLQVTLAAEKLLKNEPDFCSGNENKDRDVILVILELCVGLYLFVVVITLSCHTVRGQKNQKSDRRATSLGGASFVE